MDLTPVMQRFILHWGEMGTRWGINRTVGQIHALLYLSPDPLPADEIAATLSVARSNVSTSLHELRKWQLVSLVHVMGDRRDHFEATKDVWEIYRAVVDERKRRELDPTLTVLRECLAELERSRAEEPHTRERLSEMAGFLETAHRWYEEIRGLPKGVLLRLMSLGAKVEKLLRRGRF